ERVAARLCNLHVSALPRRKAFAGTGVVGGLADVGDAVLVLRIVGSAAEAGGILAWLCNCL
ncbi:MAG: hypothetical protein KDD69_11730, partial [Bdellovibrionales bacterium]|nr:hypothetical protein [Bdellovibrionales bacterium]